MKTQIEIFDIEQVNNHYSVTCEIYSEDGVTLSEINGGTVKRGELIEYIIDNGFNVYTDHEGNQLVSPVNIFLSENLNEIVKGYMLDTFQKGAAA